MKKCYCGSDESFENCCEPFLTKKTYPKTAEQLMRSRYSAYCVHNSDYLFETTHISTRKFHSKKAILDWAIQNNWLKLEVLNATEAIVEFKAYYMDNTLQTHCHHEKSTFKKQGDFWFYVDGKFMD